MMMMIVVVIVVVVVKKLTLVLRYEISHKDLWGSGGTTPRILNRGATR
jgi:hypothetical protein